MRFWKPRAKRLAALVCALALTASLLPTAVFADTGETVSVASSTVTEEEKTKETPAPDATEEGQNTLSVPGEQPKEQPSPEPSESPENTDATVTTSAPDTGTGSTSAPEATPAGNTDDTKEPVESPEPSEEPTDDTTAPSGETTETTDSTTAPSEENVEQQVSVPQTLAAAPAADGEPETRSGPDGTNSELGNEYITVYYNHSATAADNRTLTVKVQDETGASLCDDLTISDAALTTMTRVTIDQSKYAAYKIQSYELNGGGWITQIPASLNNDQNKTFTLNAITNDSVLVVTLQQIQNEIIDLTDSKAGGKSFGSILYKEDESVSQTTNVHIYLNNEFVTTVKDLKLPSDVAGVAAGNDDSFVLTLNDGYYFAPYDVDGTVEVCTASTVSSEQHITWCKDTRNGLYSYLNYSLPDANGTNDITLNFFTYEEGVRADFTRYVNGDTVYASGGGVSAACEKLHINYTYNGTEYNMVYDTWGQAQTIFLPRDTYVYVEPVIKDGFSFVYWLSDDSWTKGNSLYSVLPDGSLEQEETGLTDVQKGLVALTQTMAIYYNAGGYVRAQIGLHMTDGGRPGMYNEVYYHSNYPVEAGKEDETETAYYYPTLDYGTRIENCMFSVEGYTFAGWNTQEDGTGTPYTAGQYFHDDRGKDLTLYAQWEKIETPQPGIPDVNVEDLGDEVVTIKCTNTATSHPEMKSAILGDLNTDYRVAYGADRKTATITIISADEYVKAYNAEHGKPEHTASQISDDEIKVKYDATAKEWVIDSSDNTATVDVTCEDTAVTSVDLEKTITQVKRGNEVFAGQNIPQMLKVGDEITYQINVTNTGDVDLDGLTVTDAFTGNNKPSEGDGITWTGVAGNWTCTISNIELPAGEAKTYKYTCTVAEEDKGKTISNKATINGDDSEDPTDEDEIKTEVENPAVGVEKSLVQVKRGEEIFVAEKGTIPEELEVGDELTYEIEVKNIGNVKLNGLTLTDTFNGHFAPSKVKDKVDNVELTNEWEKDTTTGRWTLKIENISPDVGEIETYTYTYIVNQADAGNKLTNTAVVTGDELDQENPPEDKDEHEVTNDGDITLQPADITIYMGGEDGYTGAAGGDSSSLPEPGFYITLPADVKEALQKAGYANGEAADLSNFITGVTATTEDGQTRSWTMKKYGADDSTAWIDDTSQAHFVYRIVPGKDQPAISVNFTKEDGTPVTEDKFTLTDSLSETYFMSLNTASVDVETISLTFNIKGEIFHCGYDAENSQEGTLTVRYASEEHDTTKAVTSENDLNPDTFGVVVGSNQLFNINQEDEGADGVDVTHKDVSLLADNIVSGNANEYVEALTEKAQEEDNFASSSVVQAMYLDLVDAENGNAWLTTKDNAEVTVFWPYPEGINKESDIQLIHFKGLDREMGTTEVVKEIEAADAEPVTIIERLEDGFTFKTSSFSPFVLVQNTTQPSGGEDKPSGGDDGNNDNNNNNTNTNNQTTTVNVANQAAAPAAAPAAAVIPQTGDDMPVGLLAGLAIVAAGGLAALLVLRKRRSDR